MPCFETTVLITGATTGLGYWAAYELARQLPTSKIIISSRTDRQDAQRTLNGMLPRQQSHYSTSSQIEFIPLDVSSNDNIRAYVKGLSLWDYPPISNLILNAGAQFHEGNDIRYSADGIEITFATNHVGHALLIFLLKPYLTNDAHIILVGSGTHDPEKMAKSRIVSPKAAYHTAELLARPIDKEGYKTNGKGVQRYSSSKLAFLMFGYALERRLRKVRDTTDKQWTVVTMNPGLTPGTSLARDAGFIKNLLFLYLGPWLIWLFKLLSAGGKVQTPRESGAQLAAHGLKSTEDMLRDSGKYFEGTREAKSSVDSMDVEKQEDIWRWTVEFLGRDEEERVKLKTFE